MSARKLQANPKIVQIAPCLTEICSVYVKASKNLNQNIVQIVHPPNRNLFSLHEGTQVNTNIV